jgi:FtsP/CotA-like multicopper oxidase with cupredoxin domain
MKAYWGVEVYFYAFLNSALDGGEWSASHPGRSTPKERAPGIHWIGGWMEPKAGLDTVVKKKFPGPAGTRTPDYRARSPALYH